MASKVGFTALLCDWIAPKQLEYPMNLAPDVYVELIQTILASLTMKSAGNLMRISSLSFCSQPGLPKESQPFSFIAIFDLLKTANGKYTYQNLPECFRILPHT